jgi:hypothetical protein
MRLSQPVSWMAAATLAILVGACGDSLATSDLPRTTGQGVTISESVSEEVLPLAGCRTRWLLSNDEEPPPGLCEKTMTVRRFIAQHDGERVETSVVGETSVDPLYAMGLMARNLTDTVSLIVVDPPSEATKVRLIDGSGEVVDEVAWSGGLVALAGLSARLTVEAVDADGNVIAACPPDGVPIDGVIFACTLAADAIVPVTTIPTQAPSS